MPADAEQRHGLRERLSQLAKRYAHWVPWLSLAWGVGSALIISRNLASPSRFLFTGAALIALVLVFEAIVFRRERRAQQWIDFLYALLTQNATQYALLFVLPFLALGGQWTALSLSLPICAMCLWDPWWMKVHRNPFLMLLIQQWVVSLVTTAFFTSFAPRLLFISGHVLACVLLFVTAVSVRHARLTKRLSVQALTVLGALGLIFPGLAVWQQFGHTLVPFPLVGTWLRDPGFTWGRPEFVERDQLQHPVEELSLGDGLGRELCCVTPIVAAPGFRASLEHVWESDGLVIDVIPLPEVTGNGEEASYRTYSCKRNLPQWVGGERLACTVRVSNGPAIGEVTLDVKDQ